MKTKKENLLLNVLLGTGVYLLNSVRGRVADNIDDFRDRAKDSYSDLRDKAKDTYGVASDRVNRASDALRGEDHSVLRTTVAVLIGVGIGVGLGVLLAPASGEETRSTIADKVRSFSQEPERATGTYGA